MSVSVSVPVALGGAGVGCAQAERERSTSRYLMVADMALGRGYFQIYDGSANYDVYVIKCGIYSSYSWFIRNPYQKEY